MQTELQTSRQLKRNKMRYLLISCAAVLVCGVVARKIRYTDKNSEHFIEVNDIPVRPFVVVYYDAEDSESQRFFRTQLEPVWRQLPGAIRLKLVPYGRATRKLLSGEWWFKCIRGIGYESCHGNKYQACILKSPLFTANRKLDIIFCLMRQDDPASYANIETCVADPKIFKTRGPYHGPLGTCVYTPQGGHILAYYGEQTDFVKQPLDTQPLIYVNPKYDQINIPNEAALTDLMRVVCDAAEARPSGCPPPSAARI